MFNFDDHLDRWLIRATCIVVPLLLAFIAVTTVELYSMHSEVAKILKEETEAGPDFQKIIETHVQSRYKNSHEDVSSVSVEWCLEGVDCRFRGSAAIQSVNQDSRPITFFGRLTKYNTGWKVISFDED